MKKFENSDGERSETSEAHTPNGVVEDEGKTKAFGLVEALLFTTSTIAMVEWKVAPSISIYIPTIIIGEQGAIGTLTEWQNLYPRREVMVLGANEQAKKIIVNRASGVSERGLEMACRWLPNAISEASVRLIVKGGDCTQMR